MGWKLKLSGGRTAHYDAETNEWTGDQADEATLLTEIYAANATHYYDGSWVERLLYFVALRMDGKVEGLPTLEQVQEKYAKAIRGDVIPEG